MPSSIKIKSPGYNIHVIPCTGLQTTDYRDYTPPFLLVGGIKTHLDRVLAPQFGDGTPRSVSTALVGVVLFRYQIHAVLDYLVRVVGGQAGR